jgi:para-nitrobenzyl esterase
MLAFHTAELPYLFRRITPGADGMNGTNGTNSTDGGDYDETDAAISEVMRHAWTEFARTGVPRDLDGTAWPAYDAAAPRQFLIDDAPDSRPLTADPVTALIHSLRAAPGAGVDVPDRHRVS